MVAIVIAFVITIHPSVVKSKKIDKFDKCFEKLPKNIQELANKSFENWKKDPSSLEFKPLAVSNNMVWAAKIGRKHRALALKSFSHSDDNHEDCFYWFWIGSHEDYNNVIKSNSLNNNNKLNNIEINRRKSHLKK